MTSVDVKAAFLYGELDEELYMEQPEGFQVKSSKRLVFRLKWAIYRLKQAAKQWWIALTKSMAKLGFRRAVSDSGVFILTSSEGPSVIVIVYVDDTIFMGPDRNTVTKAKRVIYGSMGVSRPGGDLRVLTDENSTARDRHNP